MGCEVGLFVAANALRDVVLPIEPDTVPPEERQANGELRAFVKQGLTKLFDPDDGVINMSRVTHNRVYLDPAKPFLTYETLIPYLADASGGLNITFTPADISGGAPEIGTAWWRGRGGRDG